MPEPSPDMRCNAGVYGEVLKQLRTANNVYDYWSIRNLQFARS